MGPGCAAGGVRAAVAVGGGGLLCAGVVGLFLPVPGVLLIVLGLSVLGTRFQVARRWQDGLQRRLTSLRPGKR